MVVTPTFWRSALPSSICPASILLITLSLCSRVPVTLQNHHQWHKPIFLWIKLYQVAGVLRWHRKSPKSPLLIGWGGCGFEVCKWDSPGRGKDWVGLVPNVEGKMPFNKQVWFCVPSSSSESMRWWTAYCVLLLMINCSPDQQEEPTLHYNMPYALWTKIATRQRTGLHSYCRSSSMMSVGILEISV